MEKEVAAASKASLPGQEGRQRIYRQWRCGGWLMRWQCGQSRRWHRWLPPSQIWPEGGGGSPLTSSVEAAVEGSGGGAEGQGGSRSWQWRLPSPNSLSAVATRLQVVPTPSGSLPPSQIRPKGGGAAVAAVFLVAIFFVRVNYFRRRTFPSPRKIWKDNFSSSCR